jgi:hypothetical protein
MTSQKWGYLKKGKEMQGVELKRGRGEKRNRNGIHEKRRGAGEGNARRKGKG